MNLDRINTAGDAKSDGVFDFIDGVTINASNGRIYFPVRKPFGEHLRNKINPTNSPPPSIIWKLNMHMINFTTLQNSLPSNFLIKTDLK